MKRFNIYFTLSGMGGSTEAPNASNPVECESMESLLRLASENLPFKTGGIVEIIGVRIEEVRG